MAKRKRTQAEALEDYPLIAALSFEGKTQKEIADILSKKRKYTLTQQTISNDMKALEKVWKKNAAIDINTEKGRIKAHYEHLISEAYKAWERSQEDAVKVTSGNSKTQGEYSSVTREGQVGDARFLAEIRNLLDQYEDLFGIKAPKEIKGDMNFGWRKFLETPDPDASPTGE